MDLRSRLGTEPELYNTDIARLRQGMVGGQFWSVWVSPSLPGPEQVKQTLEQIALVQSLAERYPETFAMARTGADVRRIHKSGRIASLIGVEGGGQIDSSFGVLRAYRALGAGYLTLTHSQEPSSGRIPRPTIPSTTGSPTFGESVVRELNRLGMLVDLSHVSEATMLDALRVSKAPVMFSHSSARALDDHPRNVSDAVLKLVAANGGVVMVNFAPIYVSDAFGAGHRTATRRRRGSTRRRLAGCSSASPRRRPLHWRNGRRHIPQPNVTLAMVADHIEHIAKVAGVDHVGIGSDFDGVGKDLPVGLERCVDLPGVAGRVDASWLE